MRRRTDSGFTLVELAFVILVLSLIAGIALKFLTSSSNARKYAELENTLNVIEAALQNYGNVFLKIPCPSDITVAENAAGFGASVGSGGSCTGSNFTDASNVMAGGVPTKTLKIDDKYAYDPWGRKLLYAVDKRATGTGAFTTYTVTSSTIGAIMIKRSAADAAGNAVTSVGIYAITSFGPNGHGAYLRSVAATSTTRYNAGSTNTDEQKNCHCTSAAVAGTFDNIFIQASKSASTTLTNTFDDVVRYKTRMQMATYSDLQ